MATPSLAAAEHTVYHGPPLSLSGAMVVRWDTSSQRAWLADEVGASQGSFSVVGSRRRLVLDQPLVDARIEFDGCGHLVPVQYETTVYLIGVVSGDAMQGSSTINWVGQRRTMAGCQAGEVQPYGDENDPGPTVLHRAMSQLPGMDELKKGRAMAGFLDVPASGCRMQYLPQDVARFPNRNRVVFDRSGQQYTRSAHPDGWMVLDLPSGPRGFLRVARQPSTDAETWLVAKMADGQPSCVTQVDMVAADAAPSFGGEAGAARNWQQKWVDPTDIQYRLYPDHDGALYYLSDGHSQPLTWSLQDETLTMRWTTSNASSARLWQPLHRKGRYQWVMNTRYRWDHSGHLWVTEPGVHVYEDLGPGTAPLVRRTSRHHKAHSD